MYSFKYQKGQWIKEDYDPFGNNLDRVSAGKIANALRQDSRYQPSSQN